MRKFLFGMFLLMGITGWGQKDTLIFDNPKKMMQYAFSKTDFHRFTSPYFRNATLDLPDSVYSEFVYKKQPVSCSGAGIIGLFSLMNWWDMTEKFHRDSVIFPVYDHFYSLDGERQLKIPFYIVDLKINSLKPTIYEEYMTSSSAEPLRTLYSNDLIEEQIIYAAMLLDSFAYNNVILELNDKTVFSNSGRTVEYVEIKRGNETKTLAFNSSVDLSDWLRGKQKITYQIHFSDREQVQVKQQVEMNQRIVAKSLGSDHFNMWHHLYPDNYTSSSIYSPDLKFATYYACSDNKLRKPFIMVAGWGPHTNMYSINNAQNWPTSLPQLANQFNQEGLIENLHNEGFDVIICQFFPPNAYVLKNAEMLEKLIGHVNNLKFQNNSYEENIIMGFSAGALATRLALQKMEKAHLNSNGPHPHTKLYISNDGEHGGANIPLGMQHAVNYLWNYVTYNVISSSQPFAGPAVQNYYKSYALHYILNAPLSRELLHYFHTGTGNTNSPGQGPDLLRTSYLAKHTYYNHAKNGHRLGYPSFQRMVSISNGSSTPNYYSGYVSDHKPYPSLPGAVFFQQDNSPVPFANRRFDARFLAHGNSRVFCYEYKLLFKPWKVSTEARTLNPLVLDNAPGGIIFMGDNPLKSINEQFDIQLSGSPNIKEDYLYSFTPTVLTHDVKDLNSSLNNGYPDYNFKDRKLMYDNEYNALSNINLPSNYFGYPHLGYPSNHYDYTVFDALFCWDENTEHLLGNKIDPNTGAVINSAMKPVMKNFVVEEAEPFHIFLQNKRIGFYARSNYFYRVDYNAKHTIFLGNHVTQKTDFLDLEVEPNAIVEARAAVEVVFKPGVHIKSGSTFHAFIDDVYCIPTTGGKPTGNHQSGNTADHQENILEMAEEAVRVTLYPNPSQKSFAVYWEHASTTEKIDIHILDLSGKELIQNNLSLNEVMEHNLKPGYYIVRLNKNGTWISKKLYVQQ